MFYPGAGLDYSPIDLFIDKLPLHRIYYVDYGVEKNHAENFIIGLRGFVQGSIVELSPSHFNVGIWSELWDINPKSKRYYGVEVAFGLSCDVVSNAGDIVKFNYIRSEALGTYKSLIKAKIIPSVIVVHNHGFSLNWMDDMGSELEKCAINSNLPPEYLLVADNTSPWKGYNQTSKYIVYNSQSTNNKRAIFKLIK